MLHGRVVMLLVVLVAVAVSIGAADKPDPADAMFDGAYLYSRSCDDCHGDKGEGVTLFGPPLAGDVFVTSSGPDAIGYVINNGRKYRDKMYPEYSGMPKFQFITGGELRALIDHLTGPLQETDTKAGS